ncbi:MAG: hypothetical protein U5N86_09600 [Planctomycetota bacterium]|nr:hypothetical protein [Planctomycetota bacterium]
MTVEDVAAGKERTLGIQRTVTCTRGTQQLWSARDRWRLRRHRAPSCSALSGMDVVAVYAGGLHSMALLADGSLYAWGRNVFGQLGTDSTGDSVTPVEVQLPPEISISAISAGDYHNLLLTDDGTLFAWGRNNFGQLGLADTEDRLVPELVAALTDFSIEYIACGHSFSLVSAHGHVWGFGLNTYGQLGLGTRYFGDQSTPRPLARYSPAPDLRTPCLPAIMSPL